MATDTGPLHGSPLAMMLAETSPGKRTIVAQLAQFAEKTLDALGLFRRGERYWENTELGTQTLRALEVYREAGEPEIVECPTIWTDRVANWTRGALLIQVFDYGEQPEGVQVEWPVEDVLLSEMSVDDLRWCAAVKEAAHELAEEWRAEREKKEAATDAH